MKKSLLLLMAFVFSTAAINAQDIAVDGENAVVKFKFVAKKVEGTITGIKANINFNPEKPGDAVISGSAPVAKINTGIDKRDKHLQAEDMFNAAKYPTITFKSTSVEKKEDMYVMKGSITMKGVTKPATFKFKYDGKAFKGKTVVYSNDFGVFEQKSRDDSKVVVTVSLPVKG